MACVSIGFPVLYAPIEASDYSATPLHPICGIHSSYRRHRFYSASEDTSWQASWDLVTPSAIDYLVIARADCLQSVDSVIIEESADGISWSAITTVPGPLQLTGPDSRDLLVILDEEISTQYLRITILYSTMVQTCFSKIYFGKLFAFNKEPSTQTAESRSSDRTSPFRTTSGKQIGARTSKPTYMYNMVYEGITDELTETFLRKVLFDYNLFVMFVGDSNFLNSQDVIHGFISAPRITRTDRNQNKIEFDFTEMTG